MGGTVSQCSIDVLNDIAISATQKHVARCVTNATQEQRIRFSKISGTVILGDINMTQGMSVDLKCVLSSHSQSKIVNQIANDIAQKAEAQGIAGLSALGSTRSEVTTTIENRIKVHVEQTSVQEQMTNLLQKQTFVVHDVMSTGTWIAGNLNMNQTGKVISKTLITSTALSTGIQEVSNVIDQQAKSEEVHPLKFLTDFLGKAITSYVFMIVGAIVMFGLVLIFTLKYLFTTETGGALIGSVTDIAADQISSMGKII